MDTSVHRRQGHQAPSFFIAVGSQANIGGAASAPIVAAAFNPRLAPVGVLLAVLGYAVGTYGRLAVHDAHAVHEHWLTGRLENRVRNVVPPSSDRP